MFLSEDIITTYRGTVALLKRIYCDQEIRYAVLAISAAIKRAVVQGDERVALNLATALQLAEPLEERTLYDYKGMLINIAYTYYVLHNQAEALTIAQDASTCYPDDMRLQRIVRMLLT